MSASGPKLPDNHQIKHLQSWHSYT